MFISSKMLKINIFILGVTKKNEDYPFFHIFPSMFNLHIKDVTFAVVDVETTGLRPTFERIIEIGVVRCRNGEIIDTYQSFINPGRSIPSFITNYTGISDDMVEDAPYFEEILPKLQDCFAGTVLVGHNLQFDMGFIRAEFQRAGDPGFKPVKICTLKLARRMYPFLRSKSLSSVAAHLKVRSAGAHRAIYDAETTARVLDRMLKAKLSENPDFRLNDLIAFETSARPTPARLQVNQNLVETISGVPDAPGVYYFLDSTNKPVYIGKAKSLRDRLKSYFSGTAPSKSKKLLRTAKKLKIEPCNTELTAFLTEAEMIKALKPKHNVMLKEYGNKYYLRIRRDVPFPRPEVVSSFDFDGNDYFGLFISRKKAKQVLEIVDKAFQLRECKDSELKKGRRCYLAEIERCTAPCENKNQTLYDQELKAVYEFLEGKNNDRLSVLINKMKRLSDSLLFEQAGELKTIIELMLAQIHKSSLLSEPVNAANALMLVNGQQAQDIILFLEGKVYIKDYLLSESSQFFTALEDYFAGTIHTNGTPADEDLEKLKISMNWMIKNKTQIKTYYLKNYRSKEELFAELNSMKKTHTTDGEYIFEIKDLLNEFDN